MNFDINQSSGYRIEDLELPVMVPDDFLDTAFRAQMPAEVSSLTFLDMVEDKDEKSFKFQTFAAETTEVRLNLTDEQFQGVVKAYGLSIAAIANDCFRSEITNLNQMYLYYKYKDLGELSRSSMRNRIQKLLENNTGIFFDKNIVLNSSLNNVKKIISKILLASNKIGAEGRRGPANFIIVNPRIYRLLFLNPEIPIIQAEAPQNIEIFRSIRKMGNYMDMDIFINPFEKEDVIVVGRSVEECPGVFFGEYKCLFRTTTKIDNGNYKEYSLVSRNSLKEVGLYPEKMYYTIHLSISDKPSIWKKLLNKIINPSTI